MDIDINNISEAESYLQNIGLSNSAIKNFLKKDILIIPQIENRNNKKEVLFTEHSTELFHELLDLSDNKYNVDIASEDEAIKELALHDDTVNLGIYLITNVGIPLILLFIDKIIDKFLLNKKGSTFKCSILLKEKDRSVKKISFEGNVDEFSKIKNDLLKFYNSEKSHTNRRKTKKRKTKS